MPAYHYTAITTSGKESKGVIEDESDKHARQLLRGKSLIPLTLKAVRERKHGADGKSAFSIFSRKRGLNSKEIALFTRQFATLLGAGMPIEESLNAVCEQTE